MDEQSLSASQLKLLQPYLPSHYGAPPEMDRPITAALERYITELSVGNHRFGLIAREDVADSDRLFARHILDSVTAVPVLRDLMADSGRSRIYDLGSGAGLPGIPLALFLSDVLSEMVLVERRTKRVNFLRGTVPLVASAWRNAALRESGDSNDGTVNRIAAPAVRIVNGDADHLRSSEDGDILQESLVVFRAFRQTTAETLQALSTTFPPETPVCAMKGRLDQTEEEREVVSASGLAVTDGLRAPQVYPLKVPGLDAERSLLVWYTARAGHL